jgi:hypothetical protein
MLALGLGLGDGDGRVLGFGDGVGVGFFAGVLVVVRLVEPPVWAPVEVVGVPASACASCALASVSCCCCAVSSTTASSWPTVTVSPTATETDVTLAEPLLAACPVEDCPELEELPLDELPLDELPPDEPDAAVADEPPKDSATVCDAWAVPVAWTVSETVVLVTFDVRYVGLALVLVPAATAQAPPPAAITTTTTPATTHAGFSRMRRCIGMVLWTEPVNAV